MVEIPLISSLSLVQIVEEDVSPLWTCDSVSQIVSDSWISPVYVEIVEQVHIICDFSEGTVIVLVHWSCIETEVTCDMFVVIAGSCQGDLTSNTVTSKGGH